MNVKSDQRECSLIVAVRYGAMTAKLEDVKFAVTENALAMSRSS